MRSHLIVRKWENFFFLNCFVASSESPFSLMETEPCSRRTRPDALSNQPVQPQTLAHFQSIGSTEVELPHTRRTSLCNRLEQRALFWMRFGASHLRAARRGATFESIICSSVTYAVLTFNVLLECFQSWRLHQLRFPKAQRRRQNIQEGFKFNAGFWNVCSKKEEQRQSHTFHFAKGWIRTTWFEWPTLEFLLSSGTVWICSMNI